MSVELERCRADVEMKILKLEGEIKADTAVIKKELETLQEMILTYVDRHEFEPVKWIAFGLAGGVLTAALGAVIAKVLEW